MITKNDFKYLGENGFDFEHYTVGNRLIEGIITVDKKNNIYEASVHPNEDKGYRDPWDVQSFNNLNEAMEFIINFFNKETQ